VKAPFQILLLYAGLLLLARPACAQGFLLTNGVRSVYSGSQFNLFVRQDPNSGNYTGFALDSHGGNTFLFNPLLDEGVRTFFVSSNAPISLQPILANSYAELTFPNEYFLSSGTPFYVGLYTGATYPQNGIYSDPLFGWAQLVNYNGVIQFLDGALEYGGGGIYAGTQNIIPLPEPGTLGLGALGFLCFGLHRWRKR
jgi:hypothetical protein